MPAASLMPNSFDLTSDPATVTVAASVSKHRKKDVAPFGKDVAKLVPRFIEGKPPEEKLWPGRWFRRAAEILRVDCVVAVVEYVDRQGQILDFHALRHGYVTTLMAVADNPKTAQELARHSTMSLTLGDTHPGGQAIADTVNAMPPLPESVWDAGQQRLSLARNGMFMRRFMYLSGARWRCLAVSGNAWRCLAIVAETGIEPVQRLPSAGF